MNPGVLHPRCLSCCWPSTSAPPPPASACSRSDGQLVARASRLGDAPRHRRRAGSSRTPRPSGAAIAAADAHGPGAAPAARRPTWPPSASPPSAPAWSPGTGRPAGALAPHGGLERPARRRARAASCRRPASPSPRSRRRPSWRRCSPDARRQGAGGGRAAGGGQYRRLPGLQAQRRRRPRHRPQPGLADGLSRPRHAWAGTAP